MLMRRLIWDFACRKFRIVGNLTFWLNYFGIHIEINPSLLWRLTSVMESKQSVLLNDTLGGFETYRRVGTFTPRKYWMLFT